MASSLMVQWCCKRNNKLLCSILDARTCLENQYMQNWDDAGQRIILYCFPQIPSAYGLAYFRSAFEITMQNIWPPGWGKRKSSFLESLGMIKTCLLKSFVNFCIKGASFFQTSASRHPPSSTTHISTTFKIGRKKLLCCCGCWALILSRDLQCDLWAWSNIAHFETVMYLLIMVL